MCPQAKSLGRLQTNIAFALIFSYLFRFGSNILSFIDSYPPGKMNYFLICVLICLSLLTLQLNRLQPARLLCPWYFPGKNTGTSCHFLLQGILLTQGSNPCLVCLLYWHTDSLSLVPSFLFSWFLCFLQWNILILVSFCVHSIFSMVTMEITFNILTLQYSNLNLYQLNFNNGTPLQYSCLEGPMDGGAW